MAVSENTATRDRATRRAGARPPTLITTRGCPTAMVAAYHALLTNVDLALGPNAGGVLAVAAVDETADAHGVASNLALLAAQSGDRTLLIDCSLQNPMLDRLFNLDATPGLAQFLGGEHTDLRTLAQPTELSSLGVIAAGASGNRHSRLARLGDIPGAVLRLKNAADRVILVAPPVLDSTDLLSLAPYVDGILLTIVPGRTQREVAARAREILDRAEAPLLGVAIAPAAFK